MDLPTFLSESFIFVRQAIGTGLENSGNHSWGSKKTTSVHFPFQSPFVRLRRLDVPQNEEPSPQESKEEEVIRAVKIRGPLEVNIILGNLQPPLLPQQGCWHKFSR